VQVQFKRGTRSFTLSNRVNFAVNERDFVVVEADRGEDIGIVIEIITMHAFLERRMNMPRPSPQQGAEPQDDQNVCCILRLATLHERQQLPDKFHTEKDIVQVSSFLCAGATIGSH
jgi:cell fate regulator YaaT (PSP1 superfamily)